MPYVYTIVGFIGMTTNLFVLVIIATSQSLKKRLENGLIFNQSLLDCLSGLFLVLILTTKQQPGVYYSGIWGEIVCRVWMGQFALWTTLQASIFSLLVITVERYLEVVHPIFYKVNRGRRVVWIMALSPWVLALAVSIHVVVLRNGVSSNGECQRGIAWPSAAAMTANGVISLCLKFFIPVPVFIYCYTRMFLALKRGQTMPTDRRESLAAGIKNTQVFHALYCCGE